MRFIKLPVIPLFFRIWIVHCVVYYQIFGTTFQTIAYLQRGFPINDFSFLMKNWLGPVSLSVIGGLIGFFDGLPGFILILMFIMFFLIERVFVDKHFLSYLVTVLIIYVPILLYAGYQKSTDFVFQGKTYDDLLYVNGLLIFIPSLLSAIFFVHKLVKKDYAKRSVILLHSDSSTLPNP